VVRRRGLGHGDIFVAIGCEFVFVIARCVGFVEITLFIHIFVGIRAFGLMIPELEIVLIESTVRSNTLSFGAASTIDTLDAFFLRIIIIMFLIPELLSLCLTD
jgi:hypothetical protein